MKLGLNIASTSWDGGPRRLGAKLVEIAQAAEAAGFDLISVPDHVWQHPLMGGAEQSELEAYTTLAYIAAHTRTVRLLSLATAATYRPPGLLAKIVTTLDVLSGGRAMLGIGAGDYPEEAEGLGLPFPALSKRFEVLEETVRVCLEMWSGESGSGRSFPGQHVRIGRALNVPQSLSRPHPPILIAGSGERRTLPLVAKYGDACNIRPSPDITRQLELLRQRCAEAGRDYDAIEKTAPFLFDVGADGSKIGELLGRLRWLADMGIETVFGWVVDVDQIKPLEIMGRDVIPAVAEIAPRRTTFVSEGTG
ncbi:MAG TPA: TIGR03560 family F420-dependent LLM class oxidoreductase [Candidatus Acidoferrales bacterium]|nr:TIGR03560 family F420-dependent LLM class oxidoreductase [Candidatus Acidoferrales bacterium]